MVWCWEKAEWPQFEYDRTALMLYEKEFLLKVGSGGAYLQIVGEEERSRFLVEMLSLEGIKSAEIEGELLNRESLQSSIRQQFGLQSKQGREKEKESRMAKLLWEVYRSFEQPLSHEMLKKWHAILFENSSVIENIGEYRTHIEPMQIVSNRHGTSQIFYEAPPSKRVKKEMDAFLCWLNVKPSEELVVEKAALAHLYFEMIHPFEDGNGRIGRAIAEKVLSQRIGRPLLIAISRELETRKKEYYAALGACNRTLQVQPWMEFFAQVLLQASDHSTKLLSFLMDKSRLFAKLSGQLNERQTKALLRMFAEGPEGFVGGMSADKYITITKSTRATATRDLSDLVKKGALIKKGRLRHTRYSLKMESDS